MDRQTIINASDIVAHLPFLPFHRLEKHHISTVPASLHFQLSHH
ncbi:MAG: hypothetical protein ACRCSB_02475 [Bacteroidales bacterium]